MICIDITAASWTQSGQAITSEIIALSCEAGSKITVMPYTTDSDSVAAFAITFYDAEMTAITTLSGMGGDYVTIPDGMFYFSVELSRYGGITADILFSAIMYVDLAYALPLSMDVNIGQGCSIAETNGSITNYLYSIQATSPSVTENYTYQLTQSGDHWIVNQTIS